MIDFGGRSKTAATDWRWSSFRRYRPLPERRRRQHRGQGAAGVPMVANAMMSSAITASPMMVRVRQLVEVARCGLPDVRVVAEVRMQSARNPCGSEIKDTWTPPNTRQDRAVGMPRVEPFIGSRGSGATRECLTI